MRLFLSLLQKLQRRSYDVFIKRVLEERTALGETRSNRAKARRYVTEQASAIAPRNRKISDERNSVLIVDDEKNIRLSLRHALDTLELDIDMAENGQEALAKLEEKPFNLVLLDLRMPGVDGMQVLRQVRKIRPCTRVIVLSAYLTPELAAEALARGASSALPKPFVPGRIREVVRGSVWEEDVTGCRTA
jgi:CheY-like chemotaxis protein